MENLTADFIQPFSANAKFLFLEGIMGTTLYICKFFRLS